MWGGDVGLLTDPSPGERSDSRSHPLAKRSADRPWGNDQTNRYNIIHLLTTLGGTVQS